MKSLALVIALIAAPLPGLSQTAPAPEVEEGFSLMEEGAKLLMRGFFSEMEPAIKDMGEALQELQPQMLALMAMIDDLQNYQAPEILENGDIILRRKPDSPTLPPATGDIEL